MTTRTLTIVVEVLDDAPWAVTLRDVDEAVRRALENYGLDVGVIDVRVDDRPAERRLV